MAAEHKPSVAFRILFFRLPCAYALSRTPRPVLRHTEILFGAVFMIVLNVSWLVIIPFSFVNIVHFFCCSSFTFLSVCFFFLHKVYIVFFNACAPFFRLSFGMRVFGRSCSAHTIAGQVMCVLFTIYTH